MVKKSVSLIAIIGFLVSVSLNTWAITWNGSVDSDWHKPCNWTPSTAVPQCTENCTIPAGMPNWPVITNTASCNSLTILLGVPTNGLQINAGSLNLKVGPIRIESASSNVVAISGAGVVNIAPATCPGPFTTTGGCCVSSTPITSVTFTPNPTGTSTTATITANGGSLGDGAQYYLKYNSCSGSTHSFNTTGVFVVSTTGASDCPSRVYGIAILGSTCGPDPNCAGWNTVTICARSGTTCGGATCNYGDNSCGFNQANGSCGTNYVASWPCPASPICNVTKWSSGCVSSCKPCDPTASAGGPVTGGCNGANYDETRPLNNSPGWVLREVYSGSCNGTQDYTYCCGPCAKTYINFNVSLVANCYGSCPVPGNCSGGGCPSSGQWAGTTGCDYK